MTLRMRDGVIDRVVRAKRERARSMPGCLIDRMALRADTEVGSSTLAALADANIDLLAPGGRSPQAATGASPCAPHRPESRCASRRGLAHSRRYGPATGAVS